MKSITKLLKQAYQKSDIDKLVSDFARLSVKETITIYVGIDDLQNAVKQQLKDSVMQAIKDSMEEAITEAFDEMGQAIRTEVTEATNGKDDNNGGSGGSGSGSSSGNSFPPPATRKGGKGDSSRDASAGVAEPVQASPSHKKHGFVGGSNSGSLSAESASSDPSLGGQTTEPSSHVPGAAVQQWEQPSHQPTTPAVHPAPPMNIVDKKTNLAQTTKRGEPKTVTFGIPPVDGKAEPAERVTERQSCRLSRDKR